MTRKPKRNADWTHEPAPFDLRFWLVGAGVVILIAATGAYVVALWWIGGFLWRSVVNYWG